MFRSQSSSGLTKNFGVRFSQQMIFFWSVLFFVSLITSSCSSTQGQNSRAISSHHNSLDTGVDGNSVDDSADKRLTNQQQAQRTVDRFIMSGR